MRWAELDTPCLRIDLDRLQANLEEMAAAASAHGLYLRPHIKSHKMAAIARRQMELGAIGLTTAKLSEAEALAAAGLKTFFVCYPILGDVKLHRLRDLCREANVMTVVDSVDGARGLAAAMEGEAHPLDIVIKVDAGMHRVGVSPERVAELAAVVRALPKLRLRGVCIHEGTVYGEPDPDRREAIVRDQTAGLIEVARELCSHGHEIEIVSAGSTPGALASLHVPGLTEIRPGNYVFYDAMQVALGVVNLERCALFVVSTVVSHSAPDRAVIDAGSKALSSDLGGHGTALVSGYGAVVGRPDIIIERLSEEHGWLKLQGTRPVDLGARLDVIPNHACPVSNSFAWTAVTRRDRVVDRWPVEARGCLT